LLTPASWRRCGGASPLPASVPGAARLGRAAGAAGFFSVTTGTSGAASVFVWGTTGSSGVAGFGAAFGALPAAGAWLRIPGLSPPAIASRQCRLVRKNSVARIEVARLRNDVAAGLRRPVAEAPLRRPHPRRLPCVCIRTSPIRPTASRTCRTTQQSLDHRRCFSDSLPANRQEVEGLQRGATDQPAVDVRFGISSTACRVHAAAVQDPDPCRHGRILRRDAPRGMKAWTSCAAPGVAVGPCDGPHGLIGDDPAPRPGPRTGPAPRRAGAHHRPRWHPPRAPRGSRRRRRSAPARLAGDLELLGDDRVVLAIERTALGVADDHVLAAKSVSIEAATSPV